jgi:general secretion pathway protein J
VTRAARARPRAAGFTLIEVLVAIAVLMMMMLIAWGAISQTTRAKTHFGQVEARNRAARAALARMVRDLESAYLSANEDRSLQDPRTYFVAESSGEVNRVRFSSFSHTKLYADANESDQTVVAYYPGTDPDNRQQTDLFRREARRPGIDRWDQLPGEAEPIFADIKRLHLSYWDPVNRDWKETWNTQGVEATANKLPDRVRIQLTYLDENGKEVTLTTQARIYLQEMVQFITN